MALLHGGVLVDDFAKADKGLRGEDAAGDFDAEHLGVGLALPVYALVEAEGHEGGFFHLAGAKPLDFVAVLLDLLLEIGDDAVGQFGEGHAIQVLFRLGSTRLLNQLPLLKNKMRLLIFSEERRSRVALTFVLPYGGQIQRWKRSSWVSHLGIVY